MARFTWFMVGLVAVMAAVVFAVTGLTKGNWWEAFFFALAVATRDVEEQRAKGRDDERDLVLQGYVAFLDPPKHSARACSCRSCRRRPCQILTLNLLYDCSQVPIPGDAVDPELVARPRPWSLVTQALVIHVIRANRIPFLESRASPGLAAATAAVILVGLWLPVSPLGPLLGFVPLPGGWWPLLGLTVVAYVVVVHAVKTWLVRHGWID